MEIYNTSNYSVENKSDGSPVTSADLAASCIIVSALKKEYPDYAILCEETFDDLSRLENDYCLIVDPLDGTKEFVNRDSNFTVNIALAFKGKVVLGVVYAPVGDEMFLAADGIGAFKELNGKRVRIACSANTENLVMARSKNNATEAEENLAKSRNITSFIQCGSSIKGCRVAEGKADVYYRYGETSEWDTAAMQCVVEQAGGIFRQLDGTKMTYNRRDSRNRAGFCAVNLIGNLWVNNPLVSIVIPVYNGSNYLREAIDSALAQTYPNCEIVVINDGSTDNTEEICLSYSNKIRYFHKENGGVATALNYGIEQMKGEYFSWLSHDDILLPDKIELQIDALRQDGDLKKIVFGSYERFYSSTNKLEVRHIKYTVSQLTDSVFPVIRGVVAGCSLLIHRSHFLRAGVFNCKYKYIQDYDFWFRLFRNQKSIYIRRSMYIMRLHNMQDSKVYRKEMIDEEVLLWLMYANELRPEEMANFYGSSLIFLLEIRRQISDLGSGNIELNSRIQRLIDQNNIAQKIEKHLNKICGNSNADIYIFGAGSYGKLVFQLLSQCKIKITAFVDNDVAKHGTLIINDVKCSSLPEISSDGQASLIIVAINHYDEVLKQLSDFPYVTTKQDIEKYLIG